MLSSGASRFSIVFNKKRFQCCFVERGPPCPHWIGTGNLNINPKPCFGNETLGRAWMQFVSNCPPEWIAAGAGLQIVAAGRDAEGRAQDLRQKRSQPHLPLPHHKPCKPNQRFRLHFKKVRDSNHFLFLKNRALQHLPPWGPTAHEGHMPMPVPIVRKKRLRGTV